MTRTLSARDAGRTARDDDGLTASDGMGATVAAKAAVAGGWAALAAAVLLLVGLAGLVTGSTGLGPRNWLILLFEINAGGRGMPMDALRVFNAVDVGILVSTGVALAGLAATIDGAKRAWLVIAAALPAAGMAVLLATHLAGRSSVMAAVIVASGVLVACRRWLLGWLGVVAGMLLLSADFATSGTSSPAVAAAVAVGYAALIAWFLLLARRLLARGVARTGRPGTR